jgi:hypothetical protein
MNCPSSDTLVFDCRDAASILDANALAEFTAGFTMMREHGAKVSAALGESPLTMAVIQGSGYCAAVSLDSDIQASRGLLSPEEMSANMVSLLLADA